VPWPQTLEQWVASHSIADPKHLAEYLSSLKVHGERAEDRLPEEFSAWLGKFAKLLDDRDIRSDEWQEFKSKCDWWLLLNHLYLFAKSGETTPDNLRTTPVVLQDACRFLKDELDKLIPRYDTLHKDTSDLFNDPKLRLFGVLTENVGAMFKEPMHLIKIAQQELDVVRNWANNMGSRKTDARFFHLYCMARSVLAATGEYHFPQLATLTEVALAAAGSKSETLDSDTLKRRVRRYIERMNLAPH